MSSSLRYLGLPTCLPLSRGPTAASAKPSPTAVCAGCQRGGLQPGQEPRGEARRTENAHARGGGHVPSTGPGPFQPCQWLSRKPLLPVSCPQPDLPGHSESKPGPKARLCSSHPEACAGEQGSCLADVHTTLIRPTEPLVSCCASPFPAAPMPDWTLRTSLCPCVAHMEKVGPGGLGGGLYRFLGRRGKRSKASCLAGPQRLPVPAHILPAS